MVLDPDSLDLLPRGKDLVADLDSRFKPELPASHVEIATSAHRSFESLAGELEECRVILARHVGERARLASGGVHPFTNRLVELNSDSRYDRLLSEFGNVLRQQLVCGVHLHVSLPGAERVLAVYNALRSYLPDLAALAANSPILEGADTSLASIRPLISGMLPRQGIPPALESWEHYATCLDFPSAGRPAGHPAEWWWELRLHGGLGTLEIRVPDAQATAAESLAVAAVAAGMVLWLAERHDRGSLGPPAETWRINENRWSALRHGLEASMVDLETGAREPVRERLERLVDRVQPFAQKLGAGRHLGQALAMVRSNGATDQRRIFAQGGAEAVAEWMAGRFLAGIPVRSRNRPWSSGSS